MILYFSKINSIVGRKVTLIAPLSETINLSMPSGNLENIVEAGIQNNFLIKEAKSRLQASQSNTKSKGCEFTSKS